ncbi:MAG: hypothetical protein R2874_15700 [Desulfobacterales bacterium]
MIATPGGFTAVSQYHTAPDGPEKEALAIKQHDLASFNTRSIFKEIDETAAAFSQMKISLQTSEKKYRRIFENIQDIYFECTIEGEI